jgi:hypothetical protein
LATLIEALIFDGDPATAAIPKGAAAVPLSGGLSMLPVTADLIYRLDPGLVGDERIPDSWRLRKPVAALARMLSHDRRVLYVFSETFGGVGTKEAVAWHGGKSLYGPSGACDIEADLEPGYQLAPVNNPVNAGLSAIGVKAADGRDEYETVGLDRHRMTGDWVD